VHASRLCYESGEAVAVNLAFALSNVPVESVSLANPRDGAGASAAAMARGRTRPWLARRPQLRPWSGCGRSGHGGIGPEP
jgi:hypothetical protein